MVVLRNIEVVIFYNLIICSFSKCAVKVNLSNHSYDQLIQESNPSFCGKIVQFTHSINSEKESDKTFDIPIYIYFPDQITRFVFTLSNSKVLDHIGKKFNTRRTCKLIFWKQDSSKLQKFILQINPYSGLVETSSDTLCIVEEKVTEAVSECTVISVNNIMKSEIATTASELWISKHVTSRNMLLRENLTITYIHANIKHGRTRGLTGPELLLNEMSSYLGFNWNQLNIEETGAGVKLKSGSWTGLMKLLVSKDSHLSLWSILQSDRCSEANCLTTYEFDYWGMAVTKPQKKHSLLGPFVKPFAPIVWLSALLVSFIIPFLFRYVFQPHSGEATIYLYGILLEHSVPTNAELLFRKASTFLLGIWFLMNIVLPCIYKSKMTVLLAVPEMEDSPSSFKDLLNFPKYRLMTTSICVPILNTLFRSNKNVDMTPILHRLRVTSQQECLSYVAYKGKGVCINTVGLLKIKMNYYKDRSGNYLSDIVADNSYPVHASILVPKNVWYSDVINDVIKQMMSSGLIYLWYGEFVSRKIHETLENIDFEEDTDAPLMNMRQFHSVFAAYMIGVIASLISLFAECFCYLSLK